MFFLLNSDGIVITMLSILSDNEESICSSEKVDDVAFAVLRTAATSFTSSESEHLYSVTTCCFDLHPASRNSRKMIAVAMTAIIRGLLFLYIHLSLIGNVGKLEENFP